MTSLHYQGHTVHCRAEETALDAFVRAGLGITFSCKSGVCQRCMIKRLDGPPPEDAKRKLPQRLQDAGYLLACQCTPAEDMVLAPRSPEDMLTSCVLMQIDRPDNRICVLSFEAVSELEFTPGQHAQLLHPDWADPIGMELMGRDESTNWIQATVHIPDGPCPHWLKDSDAAFGVTFDLRGPFPVEPSQEVTPLPPDPELWTALDGGRTVRAVLESFYESVYADALLRPYFERVTMDRVIGKQYAFLMQSITGEAVYIGERPRNSHHWMVIPDSVFDHRQKLMLDAQQAHGLTEELIERWSRYEEQYRPDIVKYSPWARRIGDQLVETERYDSLVLGEATVCDYCSLEIAAGTEVRYHVRLGQVGCKNCAPSLKTA